ncbi:MAG: hypothetical protein R3F17_10200 [Planctomycetota bacterium]
MVSGHVDGTGRVVRVEDSGDGGKRIHFEVPEGLEAYLVDKGSITLDGISLTVCQPTGRTFFVALIPLTLEITSLGTPSRGTRCTWRRIWWAVDRPPGRAVTRARSYGPVE